MRKIKLWFSNALKTRGTKELEAMHQKSDSLISDLLFSAMNLTEVIHQCKNSVFKEILQLESMCTKEEFQYPNGAQVTNLIKNANHVLVECQGYIFAIDTVSYQNGKAIIHLGKYGRQLDSTLLMKNVGETFSFSSEYTNAMRMASSFVDTIKHRMESIDIPENPRRTQTSK